MQRAFFPSSLGLTVRYCTETCLTASGIFRDYFQLLLKMCIQGQKKVSFSTFFFFKKRFGLQQISSKKGGKMQMVATFFLSQSLLFVCKGPTMRSAPWNISLYSCHRINVCKKGQGGISSEEDRLLSRDYYIRGKKEEDLVHSPVSAIASGLFLYKEKKEI